MADRRESELLLGIFLMEAWDTAGAIEDELGLLAAPENPTAEALAPLVVVAHRLKGAAALHGFPGVSELAGAPSGCSSGPRPRRPRSGSGRPSSWKASSTS